MMKKSFIIIISLIVVLLFLFLIIRNPLSDKYNNRGLEYFGNNEYDLAEGEFKKALTWNAGFIEARRNLIKSQLKLNKEERVKENFAKLAKASPNHPETYALKGQILVNDEIYEEAITQLNKAIEGDSLLAYAFFYRGIARANLGELEQAANDYLKAQEIDQGDLQALQKGAYILGQLDDFEAAISSYNKLIELDPSNLQAYLKRGNFKMNIGDHTGAISDFDQVLLLNPELAEAYFNRGKSQGQLERYNAAVNDFIKAKSYEYKSDKADYNAGLASLHMQKLDQAQKFFKTSAQLSNDKGQKSRALYLIGIIKIMKQENSDAINYFNESIEIDNSNADAFYNRGIAYGILKNYKAAISDLTKCLELGKNSSDIFYALGVNTISLNQYEQGCEYIGKAVDMGHEQAIGMQVQYCKNYMK